MVEFNKQQIENGEYKELNPNRYDFIWNEDYTHCVATPLLWWDDASYARYQGDSE